VVLVLALHTLALLLALQLGVWRDRTPPANEPPSLIIRLLWPAPPPTPAVAGHPPATPPTRAAAMRPEAAPRRLPVTEPQAITLPVEPAPAAPKPQASPDAAPPPLDLRLPRAASEPWRAHNPALGDPRSNSARATIESRIADVLGGSDQVTMERLDDGRLRLRRGSNCVVVHPNRAERLDPFNTSVMPKPRGVEKC
jgi:hypothetical protein